MGHFSVYCGISNISIRGGDEVYFLPLTEYVDDAHIYSGDVKYHPLTLPILCEYDGYGKVVNIVKNKNTILIQKYFKTSIDDFIISIIENNRYGYKPEIEKIKSIKYMWMLKSVYDEIFEVFKKVLSSDFYRNGYDYNFITDDYSYILEKIGYTKTENKILIRNIPHNEYINKNNDVIYNSKSFFSDKEGKPCFKFDEKFKKFIDENKNTNILKLRSNENLIKYITNDIFFIYDKQSEIINDFTLIKDLLFLADKDESQNMLEKKIIDKYFFPLLYSINKYNQLFIDDLYKLQTVKQSLYNMSNCLKPYDVIQDGKHEEHLKMLNVFTKFLKNKLKIYEQI